MLEDISKVVDVRTSIEIQTAISIAISLKRIADCLEAIEPDGNRTTITAILWEINQRMP